jgi:hypothetical protein
MLKYFLDANIVDKMRRSRRQFTAVQKVKIDPEISDI